jgi:23S rRNA (cytosine1962-C5)-methyltransferase
MITRMDVRTDDVRLVDAGDGRRLEQLGPRLVDRPAAIALEPRRDPERWQAADLRFDSGIGWSRPADTGEPWLATVAGLTLELRATASGGVGLYPEHAANLDWLEARIRDRVAAPAGASAPQVLNLFAHTGLATLGAARAGAAVAHVDAARSAVSWARRNAELSGLADRPVRWLIDDAVAFVEREARREHRYDGLVIDPPTFGRGSRTGRGGQGRRWRIDDDLRRLLDGCAAIAAADAFVLVTAHTTGLDPEALAEVVSDAFAAIGGRGEIVRQELRADSGAHLDVGWSIRLDGLGGGASGAADAPDGAP